MCGSTELLLWSQSLSILLPDMPRHPGIHLHQIHLFTPLGFGLQLHGLTPHSIVNTERQNLLELLAIFLRFFFRVQKQLQDMFRDFNATCIDLKIGNNCMKMTGYIAIYKVSFSITLFFAIMFCITIGVTTSKGIRACIHNGFWLLKVYQYAFKKSHNH